MDEPKTSIKISLLFNMAWKQACHRWINLKIIFNLRKLNEFNVFTQSLIACLRQELFLRVLRSIWNLANMRSDSTFEPLLILPITRRNGKFADSHQTDRWPVHTPVCTLLYGLPPGQSNLWILCIFVKVYNNILLLTELEVHTRKYLDRSLG